MKTIIKFFRSVAILFFKDAKLYGSKIISLFLLLCLMIAGAALALIASVAGNTSDEKTILTMAVYDKVPSALTESAILAVSQTEAMKEVFNIEIASSEEEVRRGIKNGIYDAALIFEDGYYRKILNGDSTAVTMLISDKLTAAADIIENFAVTGEKLIRIAEASIEGLYEPLRETYPSSETSKILRRMELNFGLKLFALPTDGFKVETVPYSDAGLGKLDFYFACYIGFLMLICEVLFFPYTAVDCEFSMLRRIKSYRIGNAAIIIEKSLFPFIIRSFLTVCILLILGNFTDIDLSFSNVAQTLLCTWLLSLFLSAQTILLSQSDLGISVTFALSVAYLILCGGIIPLLLLPHEVSVVASFTPLWHYIEMLSPVFYGSNVTSAMLYLTVIASLAITAASLYLRRICKGGGER